MRPAWPTTAKILAEVRTTDLPTGAPDPTGRSVSGAAVSSVLGQLAPNAGFKGGGFACFSLVGAARLLALVSVVSFSSFVWFAVVTLSFACVGLRWFRFPSLVWFAVVSFSFVFVGCGGFVFLRLCWCGGFVVFFSFSALVIALGAGAKKVRGRKKRGRKSTIPAEARPCARRISRD